MEGGHAPRHAASAAPLQRIQAHLQRLYHLDGVLPIADFLISEGEAHRLTGGAVRDEQVLVREDEDGCSLGVYVADAVLDRLGTSGATGHLVCQDALQAYCHAAEGVSHFVLLLWSAGQERPVRALDLELQAEVDKGLTCLLTDRLYADPQASRELLRRLFEGGSLLPGLSEQERERYAIANDLAYRWLRSLLPRLRRDLGAALSEARRFYRMPGPDKRGLIAATAA